MLIALNDGVRPVVGVAYQPFVGEAFVAHAGGTAQWRRGDERRTLRRARCPRIEDAIVVTTDPRHFAPPREAAAFEAVDRRCTVHALRRRLYCYTQLAMGLCDVVIETGLEALGHPGADPADRVRGRRHHRLARRALLRGGDVLACGDPTLHAALLRTDRRTP